MVTCRKVRSARNRTRLIHNKNPMDGMASAPHAFRPNRMVHRRLGWLRCRTLLNLIVFMETESPGFEPGTPVLETGVLPIKTTPLGVPRSSTNEQGHCECVRCNERSNPAND